MARLLQERTDKMAGPAFALPSYGTARQGPGACLRSGELRHGGHVDFGGKMRNSGAFLPGQLDAAVKLVYLRDGSGVFAPRGAHIAFGVNGAGLRETFLRNGVSKRPPAARTLWSSRCELWLIVERSFSAKRTEFVGSPVTTRDCVTGSGNMPDSAGQWVWNSGAWRAPSATKWHERKANGARTATKHCYKGTKARRKAFTAESAETAETRMG